MTYPMKPPREAGAIGVLDLAGRAWLSLRGAAPRLWPLWLAWAAVNGAAQYAGKALAKGDADGLTSLPMLGFRAGLAVAGAVFGALTIRAVLGRGGRGLDKGFWIFLGLNGTAALGAGVLTAFAPSPGVEAAAAHPATMVGPLALSIGFLAGIWIALRLMLWPVGALMGDAAMGPARSWRLMRGYLWRYVAAAALLGALPLLVAMVLSQEFYLHDQIVALVLGQPFLTFVAATDAAVAAELYRARSAAA